jgi:hypothetical protein
MPGGFCPIVRRIGRLITHSNAWVDCSITTLASEWSSALIDLVYHYDQNKRLHLCEAMA